MNRRVMTSTLRAGLIGAGIGGASMFLLDPDRGARRRALLRDQAVRSAREGWSPTSVLLTGAGVTAGAVLIAAALARTNGHSSPTGIAQDARTAPPSPEEEPADALATEIGILIVGPAPTEPGIFATEDFSS